MRKNMLNHLFLSTEHIEGKYRIALFASPPIPLSPIDENGNDMDVGEETTTQCQHPSPQEYVDEIVQLKQKIMFLNQAYKQRRNKLAWAIKSRQKNKR